MKKNKLLIILYYSVLLIKLSTCKILFVFELFRHGARSPLISVAKDHSGYSSLNLSGEYIDIFKEKWDSPGQLVKIGYRMMYLLGEYSRIRYKNFLSTLNKENDIYIKSSHINRVILSCKSFLMGLLGKMNISNIDLNNNIDYDYSLPLVPINNELKNKITELGNLSLPYEIQYFPIFTFDKEELHTHFVKKNVCPGGQEFKNKIKKSKKFFNLANKINNTYGKDFITFFNKNNNKDFLFNYTELLFICDGFITDYENGKDFKIFKRSVKNININKFYNYCLEMRHIYLFETVSNVDVSPYSLSKTMPQIIEWMDDNVIYKNNKSPKMIIYSMHDSNLAVFELFMNKVFNTPLILPKFGSSFILEIEQNNKNEIEVNYLFNGELIKKINYFKFRKLVKNNLWSKKQIDLFCTENLFKKWFYKNIYFSIGILFVILFSIIMLCILLCHKRHSKFLSNKNYIFRQKRNEGRELIISNNDIL